LTYNYKPPFAMIADAIGLSGNQKSFLYAIARNRNGVQFRDWKTFAQQVGVTSRDGFYGVRNKLQDAGLIVVEPTPFGATHYKIVLDVLAEWPQVDSNDEDEYGFTVSNEPAPEKPKKVVPAKDCPPKSLPADLSDDERALLDMANEIRQELYGKSCDFISERGYKKHWKNVFSYFDMEFDRYGWDPIVSLMYQFADFKSQTGHLAAIWATEFPKWLSVETEGFTKKIKELGLGLEPA
jgi:hypothetical protein